MPRSFPIIRLYLGDSAAKPPTLVRWNQISATLFGGQRKSRSQNSHTLLTNPSPLMTTLLSCN